MIKVYKIILLNFFLLLSVAFISAQECDVIYVVPNGNPFGAGTKADPANLPRALQLITPASSRLWLAAGNYDINAELMLVNNITIEGGFDPLQNWVKKNFPPTVIHRLNTIVLPPPANGTAIIAGVNVSGFRLQDVTLIMDIPNGIASSAYGIYLNGCSNYNIVRVDVTSADGTPGMAGTPGALGNPGNNGAPGAPGTTEPGPVPGGAGGTGGNNGGNGQGPTNYNPGGSGSAGLGPNPGTGGGGGSGPSCFAGCFGGPPGCGSTTGGGAGTAAVVPGTSGTPGAIGPAGTIVLPGYYAPGGAGTAGTPGGNGSGGGGGGAGGGRQENGSDDWGGSGGGGGGGGFGGGGGGGGTGGGGSFAVFLFNNGAGGNIVDCKLTAGAGGAGGAGGIGGGGGTGGNGGAGGAAGVCGNGTGGAGGAGSAGGTGGTGGAGAQGLSMALSQNGGTPVTQNNILSVPGNPPAIAVLNHGCTNAEVVFTTPIAGNWDFGSGATPATANNTVGPVSVMYSSIGRKTITFGGTPFTDFIELWKTQVGGSLSHTNNPAVVGCPDVFTDTLSGISYEWDFGPNATPNLDTTTTNQSGPVSFLTTGSHTVVVWVTTQCCGRVKDSLVFNVQPNSINVTLTASTSTICAGDPITYTATPAGYQLYTFFVNNNPVQNTNSNTYLANGLQQGDSVRVAAFDGVCFSNPSAVLGPMVNPIPSVTVTSSDADDTICGGDAVTFTATPAGYAQYDFYVGGSLQQSGASNTWTSTTLSTGNQIHVIATDINCLSPWSNIIPMFVKPIPIITLVSNDTTICQGDPVTFTASPFGLDNYDFNLNSTSVQNTISNTYSSSAFNNNDVVFVSGSLAGCPGAPSSSITLTVNPIPAVTLISSDADNSICQGTSITFTASPATYGTYDFFDGATNVQSSTSNIYTTNLLSNPSSVTVVATNLGCVSAPSVAIITTVQAAPIVNAGNDRADCIDLGLVTLTGFSPPSGVWTGTGIVNPTGDFNTTTAGAGIFSLVYSYTDLVTGCSGLDSINYTVNDLPLVSSISSVDICDGQSAQIGVTAATGISFVWSPSADLNNANILNPIATPLFTTPYTVTVTDANNCSNMATTTVNVNPNPVADFTADEVCVGQLNSFTNTSTPVFGNLYAWSFGDGSTSILDNPTHQYATVDSFAITLIAQLGNCFDTATGTATTHPVAVADFTANPLVGYVNDYASPIHFINQSTNADTWNWDFGDNTNSTLQTPTHVYTKEGVYTVELFVSNIYGCNDTSRRGNYITIYENTKVFIPNVFTPNGDGQNDVLQVFSTGTRFFEFKIFNRWGEKVFESNSTIQSWDGTYQGKECQAGVYTYTAVIVYDDNTNRTSKGTITLMR